MLEETRQALDEHMDKLTKATEELDAKNHQIETILKEKQESENQLVQMQNDLTEMKSELENVKENKSKDITNLQSETQELKTKIEECEIEIQTKNQEIETLTSASKVENDQAPTVRQQFFCH